MNSKSPQKLEREHAFQSSDGSSMNESIRIVVEETSKTGEARRAARKMAVELGFDESLAEQVAIVVTEACTNLLKHAGRGEILLTKVPSETAGGECWLEVLALDRGPGMNNLNRCLQDGYSTGGSAGEGLGAIMRLSSTSDFYTVPEKGTAILARWTSRSAVPRAGDLAKKLSVGAVNVPMPGEEVCGDAWGVEQNDDHTTILVADGLGHGPEAHAASREAVRMLHLNPGLPPKALTERVHQALRSSRGAAVAVARIDSRRGTIVFSGVGNISAQIDGGDKASQHMVSVNGTAGHQTQVIREFSYRWPEDGLLLLHSDGLTSGTALNAYAGLAARECSLIAGVLYRDFNRGHDDATVVVAKAA
jgi:anti-sigma regulatory factor (Ser/Thr protein kinase)